MPYSPPEHSIHQNPVRPGHSASTIGRVIGGIDFLLGAAVAAMIFDSPLTALVASVVVLSTTSAIAWGLFRTQTWGWWCAMTLHCVILAGGTIAYIVTMVFLIRDFGGPRNHMALITSEGAAFFLTIIFVFAALLAAVPVFALRTQRCRRAYGVRERTAAEETQDM